MASGIAASAPAFGVSADGNDLPYATLGGLLESPDSARDSDDGRGFQFGLGLPLPGRDTEAVEFNFKSITRDREQGGGSDDQRSLMGHWVKELDGPNLPFGLQPFFLLGSGVIQEDVDGDDHLHLGLDGGVGTLILLPIRGWAIRAEAIAQGQLNDDSVRGEDVLLDLHFQLGLHVPLGWFVKYLPWPVEDCEGRTVDPVSGRATCPDGKAAADGTLDSDQDGVADAADACPETTRGMTVDGQGCLVEQSIALRSINFDSGSARLTADAKIALKEVARGLAGDPDLRVEIVGHTDNVGNDGYNMILSQQRAQSVRQYLIGQGVKSGRLKATGLGETAPVADNQTEEGRNANRRVEFKVRAL
ncbi:MAG: OmpA family protein [Panacagrimonas sp.]